MVFCFRTHKVCPLGASLVERHETFMAGKFVVQRGDKKCSMMALDQSQEYSIQFLNEGSGAKGLYGQQESKERSSSYPNLKY